MSSTEKNKQAENDDSIAIEEHLYFRAMRSPYTGILLDNSLLSVNNLFDTEGMIKLQKDVYPLYEEIESVIGRAGLENYIGVTQREFPKHLKMYAERQATVLRNLRKK